MDRHLSLSTLPLTTDIDISIDDNLIYEVWQSKDNFKIEFSNYKDVDKSLCAVYFSSNGIYFPNTANTFYDNIIEKDRYEWYGNRIKKAYKHIFVRDVFKQWYVKGINKTISSPEKLAYWLSKECEGFETIVIGSSAGGYAAVLFGSMIGAKIQMAFSPQLNLNHIINNDKNPLLNQNCLFLDISEYIQKAHHLFLFYSEGSTIDQMDIMIARRKNANIIMFKGDVHGVQIRSMALPTVINMRVENLIRLVGKRYSPLWFSIRHIDFCTTIKILIRKLLKYFSTFVCTYEKN